MMTVEERRVYNRGYRALKRRLGLCRTCKLPAKEGSVFCQDHLEKHREQARDRRPRKTGRDQQFRAIGTMQHVRRDIDDREVEEIARAVIDGKSRSYVQDAHELAHAVLRRLGITLPGWTCQCGSFNGEAKEPRTECRSCGRKKKP